MKSQDNGDTTVLRENLVQTAVQFLQNPKVAASPLEQKQSFLKKKGLTDVEVKEACRLASTDNKSVVTIGNDVPALSIAQGHVHPYMYEGLHRPTLLQKIKEFFNATALVGTTVYCVYWFYKKFIKPLLFGRKKKGCVEDTVTELDKTIQSSMKEMKNTILKVEDDVHKLARSHMIDSSVPQLVQELKQDLASLKALLLSRKQFPSAPASIPTWQLNAAAHSSQDKPLEREDDTRSGSSTNLSDSSLEMIRDDPPKQ